MIFEILEFIIFEFRHLVPDEFAIPPVVIGIFGLYFYNKIQEPVKESTVKQLCLIAMVFGGVAALLVVL